MLVCNSLQEAKQTNKRIIIVKETSDIINIGGITEVTAETMGVVGFFSTRQEACDYLKTLSTTIQDEKYERVSCVSYLVEEFPSLKDFHNTGDIIVEYIPKNEEDMLVYYTTAYKPMLERSQQNLEVWVNA